MDTHRPTYLLCMKSFDIKNRFNSLTKEFSSLPSAVSRLKRGLGVDMIDSSTSKFTIVTSNISSADLSLIDEGAGDVCSQPQS